LAKLPRKAATDSAMRSRTSFTAGEHLSVGATLRTVAKSGKIHGG
jgi:hypothetical protein